MRAPRCILFLAVLVPVSISSAADQLSIEFSSGELRGVDANGVQVWRIQMSAESDPMITSTADGGLVVDGMVVSRRGTVLADRSRVGAASGPIGAGGLVGCPSWEELTAITAPPGGGADIIAPLKVDSLGNVWAINRRLGPGNDILRLRVFDRAADTWGPLETLSDSTTYADEPESAIDGDDNLTIVFRDVNQGYRMYAMRYEPGSGWGPLTPIYSTPTFFQAVEVAADADGDVVVINDLNGPAKSVRSVYYDASSGTWGSPVQVSPDGYDTLLPTVAQNKDGSVVYLIYRVSGGGPPGVYGHRWDGDKNVWGPAEFVPGSQDVGFSTAGASSRFPLTVGGDGEATLLWQTRTPYTIYASRTQGGVWQAPHEVLPPSSYSISIENFSYIDSNEAGDVIGAFTRWEGPNNFYAFRYDHATGWRDVVNPYTSSVNLVTRVRVAFHNGARAVGTVLGSQDGQRQLVSLNYDGLDWQPDLLDIPEVHEAYFQRIIADRSEALLVYKAERGASEFGYKGTWLRNAVGDFDCDGGVDIDDFADYLECVTGPGVPTGPGCRDADLDGDGDADTADLAIMQRVFGE
jgi:hypothetical protein